MGVAQTDEPYYGWRSVEGLQGEVEKTLEKLSDGDVLRYIAFAHFHMQRRIPVSGDGLDILMKECARHAYAQGYADSLTTSEKLRHAPHIP